MWKGLRYSKVMGKEGRTSSDYSAAQHNYEQDFSQPRFIATAENHIRPDKPSSTPSGEAPSEDSMLERDLPALPFMQKIHAPIPERPVSSVYTRPSPDFGYDFDEDARPAPLFSAGGASRATTADAGLQQISEDDDCAQEEPLQLNDGLQEKQTFHDRMKRAGQGLGLHPLDTSRSVRDPWNGASGQASLMTPIPASNASNVSVADSSDVSPVDSQSVVGRPDSRITRTVSPVSSLGDLNEERQRHLRLLDRKTSDSLLQKPTWNVSRRIEQFSKSNSSLSSSPTVRGGSPAPDKISQPRIDQFSESGAESYSSLDQQDAANRTPEKLAAPRIQKYAVISQTSGPIKKKTVPRMEKFSVTSTAPRSEYTIERKPPPVPQSSKIPRPASTPKPVAEVNNPKLRDAQAVIATAPLSASPTNKIETSPAIIPKNPDIEQTSSPVRMSESPVGVSPSSPMLPSPKDGKVIGLRRRGLSASSMSPPATPLQEKATPPPPPPAVSRFSWTTRATSVDNTPEKSEPRQSLDTNSPYSVPNQQFVTPPRPVTTANNGREQPQNVSRFSWTTATGSEMMSEAPTSPPRLAENAALPVNDTPIKNKTHSPSDSIMSRAHPFAKMKRYDPAIIKPERILNSYAPTSVLDKREITSSPAPIIVKTPVSASAPSPATVHVVKRKPTPSSVGAKRSSTTGKELPLSPQALASIDIITALQAQLDDFELKRINLKTLIENIVRQETTPQGQNPIIRDLARRRRDADRQAQLEAELADVKRQEYEVGLRLHMAWKRREQEAPSALWVRRVTG